jgi:hypothetical protein
MNIAFFVRHFLERGTEVAIYDYAKYNEELLHNKSYIICFTTRKQQSLNFPMERYTFNHFKERFDVIEIDEIDEMKNIIEKYNLDFFHTLTFGGYENTYRFEDSNIWGKCKTIKHCVFETLSPQSNYYISISNELNKKNNSNIPVIPHIVALKNVNMHLRNELNIPENAVVFGRYGGFNEFDIPFVYNAIIDYVNNNINTYFIFMNTKRFYDHSRIIYLERSIDPIYKSKFINTCDGMIHARSIGETFGLSIAEFSSHNKPIITCRCGDLEHVSILKDKGLYYNSYHELIDIFNNFVNIKTSRNDWNAYLDYSPENVMLLFKKIFDENKS